MRNLSGNSTVGILTAISDHTCKQHFVVTTLEVWLAGYTPAILLALVSDYGRGMPACRHGCQQGQKAVRSE